MNSDGFYELTPHVVLDAMEAFGYRSTGSLLQLNSYENRVFSVGIEEDARIAEKSVIVKFYRPGRWTKQAIEDEHAFLFELMRDDFPVAAPLRNDNGETVVQYNGMWMSLFHRVRGRMPDELLTSDYAAIGRRLAQLLMVGSRHRAKHRLSLTGEQVGWPALDKLQGAVAPEVRHRYVDAAEAILHAIDEIVDPSTFIRIHGDCHRGNLLHNGQQFFFVDFDDFCNGPEIQDVWLLLSAATSGDSAEVQALTEGYRELRRFDERQLQLMEPLRGLRIIYFASWILTRWTDPSFPRLFPEFGSYRYWAEETEALEKIAWNLGAGLSY